MTRHSIDDDDDDISLRQATTTTIKNKDSFKFLPFFVCCYILLKSNFFIFVFRVWFIDIECGMDNGTNMLYICCMSVNIANIQNKIFSKTVCVVINRHTPYFWACFQFFPFLRSFR